MAGGHAPLLGRGAERLGVVGPGPGEVAVEDVTARHRQVGLDLGGGLGLDARLAVGVARRAAHQRLGQVTVEDGDRAGHRLLLGARALQHRGGGVQPEVGQRVTGGSAEDRVVGQRVAVDLAR